MNREEKIKLIEAVKAGIPMKFAVLQGQKPLVLIKTPDDKDWKCGDMVITEAERKKYLPNNPCIINKSGKELDKNGLVK